MRTIRGKVHSLVDLIRLSDTCIRELRVQERSSYIRDYMHLRAIREKCTRRSLREDDQKMQLCTFSPFEEAFIQYDTSSYIARSSHLAIRNEQAPSLDAVIQIYPGQGKGIGARVQGIAQEIQQYQGCP